MTQEQRWEARKLWTDIVRLRIATGLLITTGLVLLFLLDSPLPGLLVGLSAFFVYAAVASRVARLRKLRRGQQGSE
ncbi:hypothetical protein AB0E69_25005 [Kribbella sp. NPDC026611]|uniref:hypothetical protein n=1 Tax=Kribbella sp. NPDC026611 TaxID=3154911 RepID=UPI0033F2FD8C